MKVAYVDSDYHTRFRHVVRVFGTETEADDFAAWAHREYEVNEYYVETFCVRTTFEGIAYSAVTFLEVPTSTEAVRLVLMWG